MLPFSRAQQIKEGAGGGLVERGLEAGEEIRLLDQRHEIQPAAARAGLDAEAGVGLPARHRLRDLGLRLVGARVVLLIGSGNNGRGPLPAIFNQVQGVVLAVKPRWGFTVRIVQFSDGFNPPVQQ